MAWTWDNLAGELTARGIDPNSVSPAAVEANRAWSTAAEAAQAIAWGYTFEGWQESGKDECA